MNPAGRRLRYAPGLLHVLEADPWTAGGAGSRAAEAKKSLPGGAGSVRLGWGLLRRALDADLAAVTLAAWREGARPTHRAAAR
jgi:hypothetical protein